MLGTTAGRWPSGTRASRWVGPFRQSNCQQQSSTRTTGRRRPRTAPGRSAIPAVPPAALSARVHTGRGDQFTQQGAHRGSDCARTGPRRRRPGVIAIHGDARALVRAASAGAIQGTAGASTTDQPRRQAVEAQRVTIDDIVPSPANLTDTVSVTREYAIASLARRPAVVGPGGRRPG